MDTAGNMKRFRESDESDQATDTKRLRVSDADASDDLRTEQKDPSAADESAEVVVKQDEVACPFLSASPEVEIIDPDGDLRLTVGQNKCTVIVGQEPHKHRPAVTFLVDSRALSRASLVWKRLLDQDRAAITSGPADFGLEWHVRFPYDSPSTMHVILEIIHSRFRRVESVGKLYLIAVLSNKYDLGEVLRPWAPHWVDEVVSGFSNLDEQPEIFEQCNAVFERHLWVFWEFGHTAQFYKAVKVVAEMSHRMANGRLAISRASSATGELFTDSEEGPGVYDLIVQTRLKMIQAMLDPFRASLDMLLRRSTDINAPHFLVCDPTNRQGETEDIEHCRALILGSVSKAFAELKLWPIPDTSVISLSPKELGNVLATMNILHLGKKHSHRHHFHRDIGAHIKNCMEIEPERTDAHKSHLEAQAEKTGVEGG